MYYDQKRQVWICRVNKSRKDNPAVKKGEPYIWVKEDNFADIEYFKNEDELNKKYPIPTFEETFKYEISLLKKFKKEQKTRPNISPVAFLKKQINY